MAEGASVGLDAASPLLMEMVLTAQLYPVERFHELGFVNYLEASPDAVRAKAPALVAIQ